MHRATLKYDNLLARMQRMLTDRNRNLDRNTLHYNRLDSLVVALNESTKDSIEDGTQVGQALVQRVFGNDVGKVQSTCIAR